MIAQSLYTLTKKDVPFHWTAECEAAFDYLKSCLITTPVLAFLDFDRKFVLETDASILDNTYHKYKKMGTCILWYMLAVHFPSLKRIIQR